MARHFRLQRNSCCCCCCCCSLLNKLCNSQHSSDQAWTSWLCQHSAPRDLNNESEKTWTALTWQLRMPTGNDHSATLEVKVNSLAQCATRNAIALNATRKKTYFPLHCCQLCQGGQPKSLLPIGLAHIDTARSAIEHRRHSNRRNFARGMQYTIATH